MPKLTPSRKKQEVCAKCCLLWADCKTSSVTGMFAFYWRDYLVRHPKRCCHCAGSRAKLVDAVGHILSVVPSCRCFNRAKQRQSVCQPSIQMLLTNLGPWVQASRQFFKPARHRSNLRSLLSNSVWGTSSVLQGIPGPKVRIPGPRAFET